MTKFLQFAQGYTQDTATVFKTARNNARISGKMLAHSLQSGTVFDEHTTFTLMGFSLGSQVVKSCINRLHKLGKHDLIHNVQFLAGATYIRNMERQKQVFSETVSGRVVNCMTKNDESLQMFQFLYKEKSIGRQMLLLQDAQNIASYTFIENIKQLQTDQKNCDLKQFTAACNGDTLRVKKGVYKEDGSPPLVNL
jgi:hypothetical protein